MFNLKNKLKFIKKVLKENSFNDCCKEILKVMAELSDKYETGISLSVQVDNTKFGKFVMLSAHEKKIIAEHYWLKDGELTKW